MSNSNHMFHGVRSIVIGPDRVIPNMEGRYRTMRVKFTDGSATEFDFFSDEGAPVRIADGTPYGTRIDEEMVNG